jgi:hypothetical protein
VFGKEQSSTERIFMPHWLLDLGSLLLKIPDTVWAALIAASIAFIATTLTNKNSRSQLRMQLQHEAQQRDRERAMALRRDVYLPAAEALVRGQQALGQLADLDVPIQETQGKLLNALAVTAKIHLVGAEPTVRAVMAYNSRLMPAFLELLQLRLPLAIREQQAKGHQGSAERAFADLNRTNELMKQFNLSGQTDQAAWARLVHQSEGEQKILQEHLGIMNQLRTDNMLAQQAMGRRASDLGIELARCFPDALLAARTELGLAIDDATYRELFAKQEADVIKATDDFYRELARLLSRPPDSGPTLGAEVSKPGA